MGRLLDKVIICILLSFVLFIAFYYVTGSYAFATACSLLALGICVLIYNAGETGKQKHKLSKRDFIRTVLLEGNGYLKRLTEASLKDGVISGADGCTVLERNGKKTLICYVYKFGSLCEEDVAKCYRSACKCGAETIYALTNHTERKALAVTAYISQKFIVVGAGALYKYLLKRGMIPDKAERKQGRKRAGALLRSALTHGNAKYFVFAGFSTSLVALLTPFAAFYIAFAFINLTLAALSLAFSEKGNGKNDLFI